MERKISGKEEECGNFLEVELTGIADGLNLGVKGSQGWLCGLGLEQLGE